MTRELRWLLSLVMLVGIPADLEAQDLYARCPKIPDICQSIGQAGIVFSGKVVSITPTMPNSPEHSLPMARLEVLERFVGTRQKTQFLDVVPEFAHVAYPFEVGRSYLVYISALGAGRLETSRCSRTQPLESAGDDLKELRALPNSPLTGRLGVPVRGAIDELVKGLTLTASGPAGDFTATLGHGLTVIFPALPPGKYVIYRDENEPRDQMVLATVIGHGCVESPLLSLWKRVKPQ